MRIRLLLLALALTLPAWSVELVWALGAGCFPLHAVPINGGFYTDYVTGVAVDAKGNVYFAGRTASPDFPKGTGLGPETPRQTYGFVAKVTPDGSRYEYAKTFAEVSIAAIAVDAAELMV